VNPTGNSSPEFGGRWLAGFWLLLLFVFLAVTLPNLTLWPTLFQDEMQIIDYGRVFLDPSTDWSMGWLVHESAPMTSMAYVGMTLQELAYLLGSPSHFGARYSSLLGAVLASSLLLGWLRARKTPIPFALLLALAFLLNPIFNESYRQGRVDSWALACFFAALWLTVEATNTLFGSRPEKWKLFAAGGFAGLSLFVWPTTLSLMPLLLVELLACAWAVTRTGVRSFTSHVIRTSLPLALGGTLVVLLLALPIVLDAGTYRRSLEYSVEVQKFAASIQRPLLDLYNVYDPWLIPLALLSMLLPRNYGYNLAIGVALIMMYQTMVYPMRVLYLLPYLMAIMAGALTWVREGSPAPRRKTVFMLALSLMIGGNLWVSAWKRPHLAVSQAEARSPAQFDQRMQAAIGAGPYRVLTTEWEIYYAARALGWKTYYLFGKKKKDDEDFTDFLSRMDYAIVRNEFAFFKPVTESDLRSNGFEEYANITFEHLPNDTERSVYAPLLVFRNTARDLQPPSRTQSRQ
jgi:hypothetical protein